MANCVMCNKSVTGYYDYEGAKIPICFEHYEDGTFANYLAVQQKVGNMADYSDFPFRDFTVSEVLAVAHELKEIGDNEFVKACMEAIRLNKCASLPPPAPLWVKPVGESLTNL